MNNNMYKQKGKSFLSKSFNFIDNYVKKKNL